MMNPEYDSRAKLLAAALSLLASEQHMQSRLPGPNDDDERDLQDERLLIAAREYVKAHEGQDVVGG